MLNASFFPTVEEKRARARRSGIVETQGWKGSEIESPGHGNQWKLTSKHCWFQWFWDGDLGEQTHCPKTSLFSRAALDFLTGAAWQTAADCTSGANLSWRAVYRCTVSRSTSGKELLFCSPHSLFKTTRRMFRPPPVVKQKISGTRAGGQIPRSNEARLCGKGRHRDPFALPTPSRPVSITPASYGNSRHGAQRVPELGGTATIATLVGSPRNNPAQEELGTVY